MSSSGTRTWVSWIDIAEAGTAGANPDAGSVGVTGAEPVGGLVIGHG